MRGCCSTLITTTRAKETHTSLMAAALFPRCQQFDQITRAVMLCHKNLRESDQILFRFRLLNRLLATKREPFEVFFNLVESDH